MNAVISDEDRYLFDLRGYVTIPDAIDAATVQALNEAIDAGIASEAAPDMQTHRFTEMLGRAPVFRSLIDSPAVTPWLAELLGPEFRLDHTYADVIRAGEGPIGTRLHGGPIPRRSHEYYYVAEGQIHSGLVAVAFNLHDVGPKDGGFAAVPGSHRTGFAFPRQWINLQEMHPVVQRVTGPAGTAIVFTEALVHGTLPWTGAHERRTVFYKFAPPALSFSADYYDLAAFPGLTERQCQILEPPNARYHGRSTDPVG